MKWSIAGLLLLGVAAAVSASVLVATLRIATPAVADTERLPAETQIMIATKALPAMTLVDGSAVTSKTVATADAPAAFLGRATDVVGKLLTVPVVEGEVFTSSKFADEKSGARLASALASGMRAVSLDLPADRAGLLYPGCIVDVMVSISRALTAGSAGKEAISMTLLQAIEVLAIDDASVISETPAETEPEMAAKSRRTRRERLVTLMLNSNQAKALNLASQYGTVSLALRNPLDAAPVEMDSTMLSDIRDEYTRLLAVLSPGAPGSERESTDTEASASVADSAKPVESAAVTAVAAKPEEPQWQTLVNRGGEIEMVKFRRQGTESEEAEAEWKWVGRAGGPK